MANDNTDVQGEDGGKAAALGNEDDTSAADWKRDEALMNSPVGGD